MADLAKIADVLEAAGDYIDAVEHEKTSSAAAERQAVIDVLAEKYAKATGEEMPDSIRSKLASSDKDVVGLLQSMVDKHAGEIEPLGAPSSKDDERESLTKKEAAEAADDRFLSWVNS